MHKLTTILLLIIVSSLVAAGTFCLEYFVLSAPAGDDSSRSAPAPLVSSITSSDQAALVFEESEIDLGIAKKTVSHHFTYRNTSAMPLTIADVRPSCRCVVSKLDCNVLQPGESGSITLQADVSLKEPGAHRFLLSIDYECGDRKATATATLRVVHQPDLYIAPRYVELTVTEGTQATANVIVTDYRKESLEVLRIRPSSNTIEAKINETPSEYLPGWRHIIAVAYTDSPKETRHEFREQIFIETSDPEFALLTIPVEVHRLERLRLAPQTVSLQPGHSSEVILRDSLGQEVVIAECDTVGLAEPSFTTEAGSAKKITLSLPRGSVDASKYPATSWIRVSKPCERRLPIRVSLATPKGS